MSRPLLSFSTNIVPENVARVFGDNRRLFSPFLCLQFAAAFVLQSHS